MILSEFFKKKLAVGLSIFVLAPVAIVCGVPNAFAADKPVIALSNAYYGNTWRRQMVKSFKKEAQKAKKDGLIKNFIIVNGDGSVNQQVSQMATLILKGVDTIAIDSASKSALNGVIQKACNAGIKVVAFDSVASSPCAHKLNFNFRSYQASAAKYVVNRLHKKGNVLVVRGVEGSAPDHAMYKGQMNVLNKYKNIKVVGKVDGECSASVAQSAVANVLPSLPQVDAVLTQGGGGAYGVAKAFQQYGGEYKKNMPIIIGSGSSNFLHWWAKQRQSTGYSTISVNTAPGVGGAAFWVSYALAEGQKVPQNMSMPAAKVTDSELGHYANMKPGTIVSPVYTRAWVKSHLLGN